MIMQKARPELTFPVDWTFRIIAEADRAECRDELAKVFARFGMEPELVAGQTSSSGRYRTWQAAVSLPSRQVLEDLPKVLAAVPGVRTVL